MTHFGTLSNDTAVEAITLSGHGLKVRILTLGAIVQGVRLDGVAHSLTIGSDELSDYEGPMKYHGCIVGPVANRLQDAAAVIAGKKYTFDANLDDRHTLHSGSAGIHNFVWKIDEVQPQRLILSLIMPNGKGGFPGNRKITAQFEILSSPALRLTITTTTDAPSIVNATNHSYWNLDGSGHIQGHDVRIAANSFLPADDANALVTGEIADVTGTPYDMRAFTPLDPAILPLDNTFCVAQARRELTECLWAKGASGVTMAVATTEAGMHIYDARGANYEGFAIEAQGWPDAPNNAGFPSIEVTPDTPAVQITEWQFSKK